MNIQSGTQRRKKVERRRRTSVTVSTSVEVDLDEFDEDDLVGHLEANGYTVTRTSKPTMGMACLKDAELQEAVQEAFEKHGYKLTDILRDLI